jgi:hypothetical protein
MNVSYLQKPSQTKEASMNDAAPPEAQPQSADKGATQMEID